MKDTLRVAGFQQDIIWEDPVANCLLISESITFDSGSVDLIILPEMFTTGFSMHAANISEEMDGPTVEWMCSLAQKLDCVVTGSIVIMEDGRYYNRLLWIEEDGSVSHYDKKHLFKLAKEDHTFTAGSQKQIFNLKGWKICPLICYDLRFPEWSRNLEAYDVLIYVANFPAKRAYPWTQLLIARAIENQAYTIGVNRIGVDGMGIDYSGNSAVIDYAGEILASSQVFNSWISASLEKDKLEVFRRAYPFLKDMDQKNNY